MSEVEAPPADVPTEEAPAEAPAEEPVKVENDFL